MKTLLILLFSFTVNTCLHSQNNDTLFTPSSRKLEPLIGANAGSITGIGFTFQAWYMKNGIQITSMPIYNEEFYYSFGASYLREMVKSKNTRFFLYYGFHSSNFFYSYKDFSYNITGGGIGVQVAHDGIVLQLTGGIAGYNITYEPQINIAAGAGLLYNFNNK